MNMEETSLTQLKTKNLSTLNHLCPDSRYHQLSRQQKHPHEEKQEIKHENDQYKIEYEAELQLHLKQKVITAQTWGNHTHSYLGNTQQVYSIE